MEDFEIIHSDKAKLITLVKQLCINKKFNVLINYSTKTENKDPSKRVTNMMKLGCAKSPFFE